MSVLKLFFLTIVAYCSGQAPGTQTKEVAVIQSKPSGLNPLPIGRVELAAASKAQEIPDSKTLEKAWGYYKKWQGAWQPNHAKPSATERQEVVTFTSTLLDQLVSLAASENLGKQSIDGIRLKRIVVVGSPEFKETLQTAGTQTLKSLVLMGLVEHELDIPDGVKIAHPLLIKLLARNPLDPDLYFLYSRLSIDAQQKPAAWQAARTGIFLRSNPADSDLDFVIFIGSIVAKDQWSNIQKMILEVASEPSQASRAIDRGAFLYSDKVKDMFTPLKGNPQVP